MSPVKRGFDVAAAGIGLLAVSPLLALAALLVKLDDGGPVFFGQTRVGRGGHPFTIWKLRTMVPDAESRGRALTVGGDPRITRVGRWLRRFKVDELPQLWNVLRGEMSLVGPRPEVPRYVALYTPDQRRVLDLVPGITDPASIRFRDESTLLAASSDPEALYLHEILPQKLDLALRYAGQANLRSDIGVLIRTVAGPAFGRPEPHEVQSQ